MTVEASSMATHTPISLIRTVPAARSYLIVALLTLAIGLAMVFVGFRLQTFAETKFDPYQFGEMGRSFAHGDGFAPFGILLSRRAPLYPMLIGAVYYVFGEQPTLILLLQAVLLSATCVLVFDIARRLFNERTGWIAAVLTALNPVVLRYVGDLQLETLLCFLSTLMVWSSVRFHARPSLGTGALVGAAAALASLTKSVLLPYPFLFAAVVVALVLLQRGRGNKVSPPWAALAAMFATMAILIAPWTIRNYVATGGKFVLISSGASDAFLRGYIFSKTDYALLRLPPYVYAENESNSWFTALAADAGTEWQRDDYETDQILNRVAMQKLLAEPGEFVRKFAVQMFTFWYEMTTPVNSLIAGLTAAAAWLLAVVGLRRAQREGRSAWLLILPVLTVNVFLAALLTVGRYSVPVLPSLLLVSAFGVDTLLRSRTRIV